MDASELKIGSTPVKVVYKESRDSVIVRLRDGRLLDIECMAGHLQEGRDAELIKRKRGSIVIVHRKNPVK